MTRNVSPCDGKIYCNIVIQVLTTVESCRVHRQALANVVTLARLGKRKITDEQADEMCRILTVFKE